MGKGRKYTEEFKRQAVQLAEELGNTSEAARQLGIVNPLIHGWRKKRGLGVIGKPASLSKKADVSDSESEEVKRLRKENEELKKVNYILKRAAAFFSQDHLK